MKKYSENEAWLHKGISNGWVPRGIKTNEQWHEENKTGYWLEGREMVFRNARTGKVFQGMESEVCTDYHGYMIKNNLYPKKP